MGTDSQNAEQAIDPGLAGLAMLATFFEKPADYEQLRHRHGDPGQAAGELDLVRYAREVGFKASAVDGAWEGLERTPLPCLARHRDGGWFVLAKVQGEQALIQDARVGRPEQLSRTELEERWDGRLVLVATRAQLAALGRASTCQQKRGHSKNGVRVHFFIPPPPSSSAALSAPGRGGVRSEVQGPP